MTGHGSSAENAAWLDFQETSGAITADEAAALRASAGL